MAVVGHWLPAFVLAYLLPEASVTFFCKLAMMSDATFGLLAVVGLERGAVYMDWMKEPPAGTQRLTAEWQRKGLWDPRVDRLPGEGGFKGWVPCCFPLYADLSYSHSVELMAIFAIPIIAYAHLRWRISFAQAAAILFILVSHPLMDMLFHDAYFFMGDRAKSRVSLELWQVPWNAPFTFAAEALCAYGSYRLWLSGREPLKPDEDTGRAILRYRGMFWQLAMGHNMFSWYVFNSAFVWVMYHIAPGGFGLEADTEWTYVLLACVLWSWTVALYPLYKLELLTVPTRSGDAGAAYVDLKV